MGCICQLKGKPRSIFRHPKFHLPAFSVEVEEEVGLAPDGGHKVDEVAQGDAVLQKDINRKYEQLHAGVDS